MEQRPNGMDVAAFERLKRAGETAVGKQIEPDPRLKYGTPAEEAYSTGAVLSLEARFAVNVMNSAAAAEVAKVYFAPVSADVLAKVVDANRLLPGERILPGGPTHSPEHAGLAVARFAAAAAKEIVRIMEADGLISAVPGWSCELSEEQIAQARRLAALNVEGGFSAQTYGAHMSDKIGVAPGSAPAIVRPTGHQTIHLGGKSS